ncbi:MAG TPA: hypothetical protein VHT03_11695 [Rhizomicrobium sp.]|nr:hypothetical protein [Rhizomicrobium sp.]
MTASRRFILWTGALAFSLPLRPNVRNGRRLVSTSNGTAPDFCRAKMGAHKGRLSGGRPVTALPAEIVPGIALPSAAAIPDFTVDGESTGAAFGKKILMQTAS